MRCVYCKSPSSESKSVEHVVPESLGNTSLILPPGIVCDGCNNYFSRKVEAPFLNHPWTQRLRHDQGLPSKRGRVPRQRALASGVGEVSMLAGPHGSQRSIAFETEADARRFLDRRRAGEPMVTREIVPPPPDSTTTSRFLAKVAIGCVADRLIDSSGELDSVINEPELDDLRGHARTGVPLNWPFSVRRIYPANAQWRDGHDVFQKVWELDLFHDDAGYLYSVLVLFGIELVIHLGEPDISSYERWLIANDGDSPLYCGRYSHERATYEGEVTPVGRAFVTYIDGGNSPGS